MYGQEKQPVRLRVFRDEARDLIPLDFGPLFAANRGREDDKDVDALSEGASTNAAVVNDN